MCVSRTGRDVERSVRGECAQRWADGEVCEGYGRCDLVAGLTDARGFCSGEVAIGSAGDKLSGAMRQQRKTTGGAPRILARISINCSRYG